MAFCSDSLNVRPIAIASPTDFICGVKRSLAWGHFSKVKRGTLTTAHARDDASVPFDEGRLLAAGIPGASLVPLQSPNHLLLADEPAWPAFLAAVREFLGSAEAPSDDDLEELSAREREVLELVAEGLSNEQIGERLVLSVRTVERHLSNIYAKLRISGKAARAAAAVRYSAR
jgi:DNA-binding CsgD family transcriptional regulator